ncbi:hypothetical protein HPB51_025698 [Rhipicephalus microplus]|uniref:SH2 domain-containing protein n=1 Tax=Rhipicephalus microplus TaxID=6941 RepID=A0A9J6EQD1_RHIMP|nr:hypothetical protein HPB51_025698 [Rhipicephalus microplus]
MRGVELCGLPGQQFRDPWALLEGVQGLATRPSLPCNRARDAMLPPTHWGLSDDTVRAFMLLKARQWGMDEQQLDGSPTPASPQGVRPEGSVGPCDLRSLLSKTLHEIQPWFHGRLSRADAERRLQDVGHLDGRFLQRDWTPVANQLGFTGSTRPLLEAGANPTMCPAAADSSDALVKRLRHEASVAKAAVQILDGLELVLSAI